MTWKLNWNPLQKQGKLNLNIPKANYSWSAEYAGAVHEGQTTLGGQRIPGRPWTDLATQEYDHPRQFVFHYKKYGSLKKAFESTAIEFGGVCQDAITSPIWKWGNITIRKSGEVVGSPRNIVDTGGLRDSYKLEFDYSANINFAQSTS
jgi:hypothetical protein